MRQRKLVQEVYQACLNHDIEKMVQLRNREFAKILKRKSQGKQFTPKWIVVRI